MPLSDDQRTQMTELLFIGHKINAIKIYRGATGAGLKESKDFVDALEASLQQTMPEKFNIIQYAGPPASFVITILVGILAVGGAIGALLYFK
jgi:hypothetical protein